MPSPGEPAPDAGGPPPDASGVPSSRPGRVEIFAPWLALAGLAVVLCWTQVADYDLWWHLNLGRQILEQRTLHAVETFSYTRAGEVLFAGEWLANVVLFGAHQAAGLAGLALLKAAVLVVTCSLLIDAARREARGQSAVVQAAFVVAGLALFAIRFRLFDRPFLLAHAMVAAFIWLLLAYDRSGRVRYLVPLPLLAAIWANLSSGFFYGPLLVAALVVAHLVRRRIDVRGLVALAATAVATLANPEGIGAHAYLRAFILEGGYQGVGEHQPLSPALLWGYGARYTWGFQALVVLTAAGFVVGRGWRAPFKWIVAAGFLVQACLVVRLVDLFALASIVTATPALATVFRRAAAPGESRGRWLAAATTAVLIASAAWATTSETYAFGLGARPGKTPEAALAFLDDQGLDGRAFNSYPFGGYMAWRPPRRQVYIDGRMPSLFTPEDHRRYFDALRDTGTWDEEARRWGFTVAVLEADLRDGLRHFPKHLASHPGWALVFWDGPSAVYVARLPEHAAVIDAFEYRVSRPAANDFSYLDRMVKGMPRTLLPRLLAQLDAEIARSPGNQEPRLAKAFLLLVHGGRPFFPAGRAEIETCLEMEPDLAMEHSALAALLLEEGRTTDAREEVLRALALDPRDPNANGLRSAVGLPPPDRTAIPGHP